jgi:hypothetical protein
MIRSVLPAVLFLGLAACAVTPVTGDMVTSGQTAIRIAQKACAESPLATPGELRRQDWHASLDNRVWSVWLEGPEISCHEMDVRINAADGTADACRSCVVVTQGGSGKRTPGEDS